jgi:hypothetical protein
MKEWIRAKIETNNNIIEQVTTLAVNWAVTGIMTCMTCRYYDLKNKLQRFNYFCGAIKDILINKSQQETILKFYKALAIPALLYASEC